MPLKQDDGKLKRATWLYVVAGLLVTWVVVPKFTAAITLPMAGFVGQHIAPWLAPINWVLGLVLLAICQGPLFIPKYFSVALNILLLGSILFFLGSWHSHPYASPLIGALGYLERSWIIPFWEGYLTSSAPRSSDIPHARRGDV
jgi:hypothetical protein